ncbi:SusC/RagA family TonB-linked outer membrane protein [Anseongella ginsenosidimutans]|uniref:SusC/RagA family TonB-linked outer membrane protein n=1 Tax=Anseongella ginsenosidimutans TaxID=496056 RepID=UPI001CEF581A|nr:TonB-dependent receptor [Anseongella ginsenosidimutans]
MGDNSPLIVVDGIANRGLERLNAADIESITVLKDASAAIYGAQAANGVILVTTKRGRLGKPQISLNYNEGLSTPTVLPESIDAATYLEMLNEIGEYAGQAPKYSEEEIQNYREGTDPWLYPNTDWYAETFRDAAPQRSANLTISGGQEYLSYFISAGTQFQDAIYKNSATNYKQMNFRVNLDGKVSDNVRYSIDVSGREQYRNYPTRSASDIFTMLRRGKPHMHAYWPNGMNGPDIEYGNNPVVVTTNQTGYDRNKTTNLMTRAKLDVKLPWIEGLSLSGNVAFDRQMDNDKLWRTPWFLYSWDRESVDENGQPVLVEGQKGFTNPELTQEMEDADRLTLNALLNYERNFGGMHNFKFLAGTERISGESMIFSAFRKHFVSEAIDQLFAGGDADKTNSGQASEEARLNYFGRVNYDFKSKYLFEFVWRYDGSFIFPREKRFGFFPGVSLGWRISEENFWEGIRPVVSHLKIRGSWGQTGNDRIDTYQYMASYGYEAGANEIYVFNGDVESKILGELRIPNRNVTWEVANQSNIGFDGELFNSKVSFSADYFYNVREDILWRRSASVPASSGLTLPSENIGEVVNQGAEFQLGYRNKAGDLHYEVSANINFNKNRIKFWDETPGVPEYQQSTGHPMNTNLYYKAIGIFRDQAAVDAYPHWTGARPGDVIFEDVNQDGEINGLDRVRIYKTDLPTQTGGFNIDLAYKNFYSSIFFQWAAGAVRNDYYEMQGEVGNFLARDVEGRWTPENPDADQPRIWNRYSEYWRSNDNTYWLQSSDYVRLKSFELGYNLPASLCESLHMSAASIYFTGLNLLTFTGVEDFDPESTSAVAYPLNKVYNFGVTLTF